MKIINPNPDIEMRIRVPSLGTYSECKKYVVTSLVISYFLHLLDVLRGRAIIVFSISGFGINKIILACILTTTSFLSYAQPYDYAVAAVKSNQKTSNSKSITLPEIAIWEAYMTTYGQQWGETILAYSNEELILPVARNNVYYDGQRVFFQIADYTGNIEPWYSYAQRAEEIYRDHYAIPNNYGVQGHRRFSTGLYLDAILTSDALSISGVLQLRDQPPFSNPETFNNAYRWYWSGFSRAIAYAIESHVISEKLGHARLEGRMELYINMALNHIYEWTTGDYGSSGSNNRLAPFMVGLTAEALILDYEWSITQGQIPDVRIPIALKAVADHLMIATVKDGPNAGASMWIENLDNSGYGTFRYEDAELSPTGTNPAPTLNLLIAPMYAWLYKHYGEVQYLHMGDKVFIGGVRLAEGSLGWAGKQFNQNYRWSFDYIKWRNQGIAADWIFTNSFEIIK